MPRDKRTHRGAHPADARLFCEEALPDLRSAVSDLAWLLTHGYSLDAALKLVGDRYQLRQRQRMAVRRCACSDDALTHRARNRLDRPALAGRVVCVDGFNFIVTVEAALSGGVVLLGRDGCARDLASVHGSYRAVQETDAAIERIGECLAQVGPERVTWLLDRPVSNSGRLRRRIEQMAEASGWPWSVRLALSPDADLVKADGPIVTTDSTVLDRDVAWVNLAAHVIRDFVPEAWVVELGG